MFQRFASFRLPYSFKEQTEQNLEIVKNFIFLNRFIEGRKQWPVDSIQK